MVLLEMVYCRITGKTRDLPKVHHFIPMISTDTKKNVKKARKRSSMMMLGSTKFKKETAYMETVEEQFEYNKDKVKVVLDMSQDGPVFKMLENLLQSVLTSNEDNGGRKTSYTTAHHALEELLKSGIPGIESIFARNSIDGMDTHFGAKFSKMSIEDKKAFLNAVSGSHGKVNCNAAIALLAAAASGGNAEMANKIIHKLVSGNNSLMNHQYDGYMRDTNGIDPCVLGAMISTSALISQGVSNREIVRIMEQELQASGMRQEEILGTTLLMQKAFAEDNSKSTIKQIIDDGLKEAELTYDDVAKTLYIQKILTLIDEPSEDIAKYMYLQSLFLKYNVPKNFIADAMDSIMSRMKSTNKLGEIALRVKSLNCNSCFSDINPLVKLNKVTKLLTNKKLRCSKRWEHEIASFSETDSSCVAMRVEKLLQDVIDDKDLSEETFCAMNYFQKVARQLDLDVSRMGKVAMLQRKLMDLSLPVNDILQAMSMIMNSLENKERSIEDLFRTISEDINRKRVDVEDLCWIQDVVDNFQKKDEINDSTIKFFKKAIKQRKTSIENVSELLTNYMWNEKKGETNDEEVLKTFIGALKTAGLNAERMAQTVCKTVQGGSVEDKLKQIINASKDCNIEGQHLVELVKHAINNLSLADSSKNMELVSLALRVIDEKRGKNSSGDEISTNEKKQSEISTLLDALNYDDITLDKHHPEEVIDLFENIATRLTESKSHPDFISKKLRKIIAHMAGQCEKGDQNAFANDISMTLSKIMLDNGYTCNEVATALKDVFDSFFNQGSESGNVESPTKLIEIIVNSIASNDIEVKDLSNLITNLSHETNGNMNGMMQTAIKAMIGSGQDIDEISKFIIESESYENICLQQSQVRNNLLQMIRNPNNQNFDDIMREFEYVGLTENSLFKCLEFEIALSKLIYPQQISFLTFLANESNLECSTSLDEIASIFNRIKDYGKTEKMVDKMRNAMKNERKLSDITNMEELAKMSKYCDEIVSNLRDIPLPSISNEKTVEQLRADKALIQSINLSKYVQHIGTQIGVKANDFVTLLETQRALLEAGSTPNDIINLMEKVMKRDREMFKTFQQSIDLTSEVREEDVAFGLSLWQSMNMSNIREQPSMNAMRKYFQFEQILGKEYNSIEDVLEEALNSKTISMDDITRTLSMQKLMDNSGVDQADLLKLGEIERIMRDRGFSEEDVMYSINQLIGEVDLQSSVFENGKHTLSKNNYSGNQSDDTSHIRLSNDTSTNDIESSIHLIESLSEIGDFDGEEMREIVRNLTNDELDDDEKLKLIGNIANSSDFDIKSVMSNFIEDAVRLKCSPSLICNLISFTRLLKSTDLEPDQVFSWFIDEPIDGRAEPNSDLERELGDRMKDLTDIMNESCIKDEIRVENSVLNLMDHLQKKGVDEKNIQDQLDDWLDSNDEEIFKEKLEKLNNASSLSSINSNQSKLYSFSNRKKLKASINCLLFKHILEKATNIEQKHLSNVMFRLRSKKSDSNNEIESFVNEISEDLDLSVPKIASLNNVMGRGTFHNPLFDVIRCLKTTFNEEELNTLIENLRMIEDTEIDIDTLMSKSPKHFQRHRKLVACKRLKTCILNNNLQGINIDTSSMMDLTELRKILQLTGNFSETEIQMELERLFINEGISKNYLTSLISTILDDATLDANEKSQALSFLRAQCTKFSPHAPNVLKLKKKHELTNLECLKEVMEALNMDGDMLSNIVVTKQLINELMKSDDGKDVSNGIACVNMIFDRLKQHEGEIGKSKIEKALQSSALKEGMPLEQMLTVMMMELRTKSQGMKMNKIKSLTELSTQSSHLLFDRSQLSKSFGIFKKRFNPQSPNHAAIVQNYLDPALNESAMMKMEINTFLSKNGLNRGEIESILIALTDCEESEENDNAKIIESFYDKISSSTDNKNFQEILQSLERESSTMKNILWKKCPLFKRLEQYLSIYNLEKSVSKSNSPSLNDLLAEVHSFVSNTLHSKDESESLSMICTSSKHIINEMIQDMSKTNVSSLQVHQVMVMAKLTKFMLETIGTRTEMDASQLKEWMRCGMVDLTKNILKEFELEEHVEKVEKVFGRKIESVTKIFDQLLVENSVSNNKFLSNVALLKTVNGKKEMKHCSALHLTLYDILMSVKDEIRCFSKKFQVDTSSSHINLLSSLNLKVKKEVEENEEMRRLEYFENSKMPILAYSQYLCVHRMAPCHTGGPTIGIKYYREEDGEDEQISNFK